MRAWKPETDRASCVARYGNMAQWAGLRRFFYADGKAAGVEAVEMVTGGGLRATILPGRGMDVAQAEYKGAPIAYLAKAGITAPAYHDARGSEWLKSFFAGLVTTCGVQNAGPDCAEGNVLYGLHGDISNVGCDNVCAREGWADGQYTMSVSGRASEGRLHGAHLSRTRTVSAVLGENALRFEDAFENEGDEPARLMFFYHINLGYPVLSAYSHFVAPSARVWANTDASKAGLAEHTNFGEPARGAAETQYFHEFAADADGRTVVALINDELELGVSLRFSVRELPRFAQWKILRAGEYVSAFEPGICHPVGRARERELGEETYLQPMEKRVVRFEIGILDGAGEICDLRREVNALKGEM